LLLWQHGCYCSSAAITLAAAVAAAAASAAATDLLHEAINDVTILHAHLQKTQGKPSTATPQCQKAVTPRQLSQTP
jgi:hypothetical protein